MVGRRAAEGNCIYRRIMKRTMRASRAGHRAYPGEDDGEGATLEVIVPAGLECAPPGIHEGCVFLTGINIS